MKVREPVAEVELVVVEGWVLEAEIAVKIVSSS